MLLFENLFSDPTYIGGSTIAVKKENNKPKITDYKDKRIAVLTGSNFPDVVKKKLFQNVQVIISHCILKTGSLLWSFEIVLPR